MFDIYSDFLIPFDLHEVNTLVLAHALIAETKENGKTINSGQVR